MQKFEFDPFIKFAEENSIPLPENIIQQLEVYGNLLLDWNEKINLTAIKEPEEIVIKHFTDCLSILKHIQIKDGQRLIDIGSGAGFPGMVLKLLRPNAEVFLLDGHAKRFIFLDDLQKELGIFTKNIHQRAEIASKTEEFREAFDFVTARAVARLEILDEYCLPFLKVGGTFVSMKGPEPEEELSAAEKGISILGGGKAELFKETLPDQSIHSIIKIKKISQTPTKYPRPSGKITKQPL